MERTQRLGWAPPTRPRPQLAPSNKTPSRPPHAPPTSMWASVSSSMMRAWGVATTLCPLISMMRCPTRTPPRSAMPPRRRLQIWGERKGHAAQGAGIGAAPPPSPAPGLGAHDAILHAKAQLLTDMRPADDGRGDRRAVDDAEGHQCLRLHFLCKMGACWLGWAFAEGAWVVCCQASSQTAASWASVYPLIRWKL